MLKACAKAVFSLGNTGGINGNLRTAEALNVSALCATGWLMTNVYQSYTLGFTRLLEGIFNQLNSLLINTFHTTNKDNEILYKLIIINSGR